MSSSIMISKVIFFQEFRDFKARCKPLKNGQQGSLIFLTWIKNWNWQQSVGHLLKINGSISEHTSCPEISKFWGIWHGSCLDVWIWCVLYYCCSFFIPGGSRRNGGQKRRSHMGLQITHVWKDDYWTPLARREIMQQGSSRCFTTIFYSWMKADW